MLEVGSICPLPCPRFPELRRLCQVYLPSGKRDLAVSAPWLTIMSSLSPSCQYAGVAWMLDMVRRPQHSQRSCSNLGRAGYDLANQTAYLDDMLRWGLDWLLKVYLSRSYSLNLQRMTSWSVAGPSLSQHALRPSRRRQPRQCVLGRRQGHSISPPLLSSERH